MIEEFIPHDQRHEDFYEQFLEQRTGNLNRFTESLAEDSNPFPTRPLSSVPTITSYRRDSVTSSDSGFGLPQVFSPTLPITPEHLPQHSQFTGNSKGTTIRFSCNQTAHSETTIWAERSKV